MVLTAKRDEHSGGGLEEQKSSQYILLSFLGCMRVTLQQDQADRRGMPLSQTIAESKYQGQTDPRSIKFNKSDHSATNFDVPFSSCVSLQFTCFFKCSLSRCIDCMLTRTVIFQKSRLMSGG